MKKKILIIEDEKPLLMAIKSKLEIEGYGVFFAEDGEAGLDLIKEKKPDLVLLDILLPKKDGFDILEDLDKEKNKTPVMIISNSGQPVEIDRAVKLGVKDYLIKANFSPDEVLEKVKKLVGPGVSKKKDAPAEEGPLEEKTVPPKPVAPDGASVVLVIEDDEFLREVISQKLFKEGFDVQAAIDANGAFEIMKEKAPHAILLDLILPGMDGYEFMNQVKKNPLTKDVPIIILSNLGQKEDIDRAKAAGAVDYLIKANFTPAEIVQKVRDAIGKKYL